MHLCRSIIACFAVDRSNQYQSLISNNLSQVDEMYLPIKPVLHFSQGNAMHVDAVSAGVIVKAEDCGLVRPCFMMID